MNHELRQPTREQEITRRSQAFTNEMHELCTSVDAARQAVVAHFQRYSNSNP